ncbi:MAG: zf-HC2 domain-containing protein [Vicinamibacteria bacterium]|jgi:hypothetical protein|nr:zf-HC2 domain-containing protein [Vicinamibacteria bacterium]
MTAHVQDRLSAYWDNALESTERMAVEGHLSICEECRQALQEIAEVDGWLRDMPVEAPPFYFTRLPGHIRDRLNADAAKIPWRLPAWSWAAAAALIMAIAIPLIVIETERISKPIAREAEAPMAPPAPAVGPVSTMETKDETAVTRDRSTAPTTRGHADAESNTSPHAQMAEEAKGGEPASGFAGAPTAAPPPSRVAPSEQKAQALPQPSLSVADEARADKPDVEREAQRPEDLRGLGYVDDVQQERGEPDKAKKERDGAVAAAQKQAGAAPARVGLLRRQCALWRSALRQQASGAEADQTRLRLIAASFEIYALTSMPADLAAARREAQAYIERPDATERERIRALLRNYE